LLLSVIVLPLRFSFVRDAQIIAQKNLPIQIVFDVSLSMAAMDLEPSRFVAAKSALIELIQQLDGYHISLITFSGKPFVYIPFSSDSSAIISRLELMNLWDFPPVQEFLGTAIGDALLLAFSNIQQFSSYETYAPWIVILITDGDSNVGFDPLDVISYYQKLAIPLFVLWVGHSHYFIGRDSWGTDIMTDIHFPLLESLAKKTWGMFYKISANEGFDTSFADIRDNILLHQYESVQYVFWELNKYLLYLLLFLLFCFLFLRIYLLINSSSRN